jgi:hypothetical protein
MRSWKSALCSLLLISGSCWSQEQLAIRLNEKGLMKIMEMALKYNTASKESRTVIVPQNIYKFTLPKATLLQNPIVSVVNEISDLNLNADLDFYLNTSEIKISGEVDAKSLKTTIFNSHDNGFDVRVSIALPEIVASASKLALCEDKAKNVKSCGRGLQANINGLRIKTKGAPLEIFATLRLRTDGNVARMKVLSVSSNLEETRGPRLDVNFQTVTIPRVAIIINGQETELDTSRIKDEILKRRSFLAAKLIGFAADFITSDLAEMMNVYLMNKQITTSWDIYKKSMPVFDEFLYSKIHNHSYDRPVINAPKDPISLMISQIAEVIQNAEVGLSLRKISTPLDKDIELAGKIKFILNNRQINVGNTISNSSKILPKLDLTSRRHNDINMAISEPLINGALDLVNSTGLFQEVFRETANVRGVSIRDVKVHFKNSGSIAAVVNTSIDLKKLHSGSIAQWLKNWIAAWLERNNNDAIIYFPIEIDILPQFKNQSDGSMGMKIFVKSPFTADRLINTFNYPSNLNAMKEIVRKGVMDELQTHLIKFTNQYYTVDITKFMGQAGVDFRPRSIAVSQNAYLLLDLDILDIKFSSQNPNKR